VYDVIIVGASFAGLAVANQLRDYRVLLIDHKPVGVGQTSACGTILQVLRYWQLMDSLFQTHDRFILHTPRRELQVRSPYLWCTFDYQQLCRTLFARSGAEFVQARAQGYDGDTVQTSKGSFAGRYVVDASGSRAVLASSIIPGYANDHQMNLGIEMICVLPPDHPLQRDGLHFWYDRGLLRGGWAWAFPRGDHVNVGLGAFGGVGHLRAPLLRLVERLQLEPTTIHGAHLPFRLRAPYVDKLFVVGDAAGQCLGLSGEGIRSSMYFGEFCGRVLRRVLAGRSSLREGLEAYEGIVLERQRFFRAFARAQAVLMRAPDRIFEWIAMAIAHDRWRERVFHRYWRLTNAWDTLPATSPAPEPLAASTATAQGDPVANETPEPIRE
jgi:flavin-dependent dehydrogenase